MKRVDGESDWELNDPRAKEDIECTRCSTLLFFALTHESMPMDGWAEDDDGKPFCLKCWYEMHPEDQK